MNYKRLLVYITFTISAFAIIHAQTGKVNGYLKDKQTNAPVPFANIIVANTTTGTSSDVNGFFEIGAIGEEFIRLQISSLGYEPLTSEVIHLSRLKTITVYIELTPTSQQIGEIKVTTKPFMQKAESPVSMQSIGIDFIEKSAGANRDIGKVLQSFPGVGSVVSFRNDLIVRGGGPSENRFYLDGIEIPTLNHFSTQGSSGGPVAILNVDFIRSVDYYSGAFPAARGNSLSSVFEFRQIDGNSEKPLFKGSVGASELSFSVNTPLGDKTTLIASARRSYLQFLFKQLQLPFLPTFNDFSFKTKTRFNQKNELTIIGIGAIDQFELNELENPSEETEYILNYLPVYTQWNYAVGAVYKRFVGNSYITLVASRNKLNNQSYKYFNNIETAENLNYDYDSNETENKFRLEFNTRPNNYAINVGTSIDFVDYDNQTYNKVYQNDALTELRYSTQLPITKYAVFGSVSHPYINQRLILNFGIRMDANNYSDNMSNPLNQLSPRLAASFRISSPVTVSASIGRYYQLPAYTTMGYKLTGSSVYVNSDNGLKYISADHYIAGIQYSPDDNVRVSIEGFVKNYNDYPLSVRDQVSLASKGGDFGTFGDEEVTPTSSGKASGFELLFRKQTENGTSIITAYTFVRSRFTDGNNQLVPSSWDSKHILTTTVNQKLKRNWNAGFKWRFVGGLPYTPNDEEKSSMVQAWDAQGRAYLDYSQFNELRLGNFHQLDVRIDKAYDFKTWSLGFYLDIQNFYNRKYNNPPTLIQEKDANGSPIIINPTEPIEQQQYKLKTIQTTSGTLLPTIGILVEF